MIVAISLVMQRNETSRVASHARLSILHNCISVDDGMGKAVQAAMRDEPEYSIASICASKVKMPPAENQGAKRHSKQQTNGGANPKLPKRHSKQQTNGGANPKLPKRHSKQQTNGGANPKLPKR